jgi:hypothetical protein
MTQSALLMLSWATCGTDAHWCDFLKLRLGSDSLAKGGVYIIWSEDANGARKTAVYVGQGKPVADCLARHRSEPNITRHGGNGRILRATWPGRARRNGVGWNATSQTPCNRWRVTAGPATTQFQ